jgi:hypothetical protein
MFSGSMGKDLPVHKDWPPRGAPSYDKRIACVDSLTRDHASHGPTCRMSPSYGTHPQMLGTAHRLQDSDKRRARKPLRKREVPVLYGVVETERGIKCQPAGAPPPSEGDP